MKRALSHRIVVRPVTPSRWPDLIRLFGARGACGGCWCMTPRLPRAQYEKQKGAGNRRALKRLVDAGPPPGLLAYEGRRPVGWCSVAPRESFGLLARSHILRPVDARPVWSIVCLFVDRGARGRGVSRALIEGAVAHARSRRARIVEAYPVDPKKKPMPPVFAWPGILSAYRSAGFAEVVRRSPTRPIVRRRL